MGALLFFGGARPSRTDAFRIALVALAMPVCILLWFVHPLAGGLAAVALAYAAIHLWYSRRSAHPSRFSFRGRQDARHELDDLRREDRATNSSPRDLQ